MAFLTNVSLAAGAGKTVAARTFQQLFVPDFSAMGTGDIVTFFFHE